MDGCFSAGREKSYVKGRKVGEGQYLPKTKVGKKKRNAQRLTPRPYAGRKKKNLHERKTSPARRKGGTKELPLSGTSPRP